MVYRGIPSTACSRCRRRKLRCSHQNPQCSQCVNAGVTCSGYRDQLELMFCDESASVVEKVNKSNASSRVISKPENLSSPSPSKGKAVPPTPTKEFDLDGDFIGDALSRFEGFGNEGSMDPFDGMVGVVQADRKYMTQYCAMDLDPILIPLGRGARETQWTQTIDSDPMLFYFTLWKVSTRLAMLDPKDASLKLDVVRYYQKTVYLLNERLQDPSYAVSDETAKVVVGLASKAIAERNAAEAGIHIEGLRKMLLHAGGQEQSGIHLRLQEAVFWHELCYASAFNDAPLFHEPQSKSSVSSLPLLVYFSPLTSMSTLGVGFRILSQLSSSFDTIVSLITELRSLSVVAEFTTPGRENHSPVVIVLSQRHANVKLGLLNLSLDGVQKHDARILKTTRIATLIYTSVALQYNHPSTIPREWLEELKEVLEQTDMRQTRQALAELHCWILFTGCVCCLESEGELREWFFGMLARMVVRLNVTNERALKGVLTKFLWVDSRSTRFGEFWELVERLL